MIVVTTPRVEGMRIVRVLGLVRGNTVRSRHLGRDLLAGLRNVVGGEIPEYTKLLAESREQAVDRMVEEARGLGANAIVQMRFQTSMIMRLAAELLVYGTAVVVEEDESRGAVTVITAWQNQRDLRPIHAARRLAVLDRRRRHVHRLHRAIARRASSPPARCSPREW